MKRFNDRERPIINAQAVAGFWGFKSVTDLFRITGDPWAQNLIDQLFLLAGTGIGLWYFIELGCMRGTVGPNAHGEDPVPESGVTSSSAARLLCMLIGPHDRQPFHRPRSRPLPVRHTCRRRRARRAGAAAW